MGFHLAAEGRLGAGRKIVEGRCEVVVARRVDGFQDEERVRRALGEHGAHAVAPVPATAHRAGVVEVAHLARQRLGIGLVAQRAERVAALCHREAQVAGERVDVLAAARQRVRQRHGIVDVHERIDGAHFSAAARALQKRLDGRARALLRLELLERLAPHRYCGVLADGGIGHVGERRFVRLDQRRLHVLARLVRVVDAPGHHNADLRLGEQLPKRRFDCKRCHDSLSFVFPAPSSPRFIVPDDVRGIEHLKGFAVR